MSDPLKHMISERWITQRCHIPALSAGNLPHVDPYTNVSLILPNFLSLPYAVPSPQFSWPTISNFEHVDYVHQVWTQSDVVGCMDECNMMVVIHTDSRCALTSVSDGSRLPGGGPRLGPDRTVQSGWLPGKQGYPPGSVTGSNRTAVLFYGSYNSGSN